MVAFFFFNKVGASAIGKMKERKDIKIGKGKDKCMCSIFIVDMIVYIENPKESMIELLEQIYEHQVSGHKINAQKGSVIFLVIK